MSGDMCLTSVHFMSHFQSSHQNCIAASSRSHHTSIQAPGFVFHLQPVMSRSREFHFISIQLPSQPHTHLKMCVLPLFRSRLTSLQTRRFVSRLHPGQSIQVVSYLHVGPENCISASWGSHLTPTEVSNFASHLHPGHISTPSSFWDLCLTSIQVLFSSVPTPRFASHLHLGSNSHVLPQSKSRPTSIQIPLFESQFHPGPIFCLLLRVSSDYVLPITGQVTEVTCPVIGQAQPELTPSKRQKMGPGPHPSRVPKCAFHLHPDTNQPHLSNNLSISPAPISVSPPPRHLNLGLTSIPVISHLHPSPYIHVSPPYRSCLISIQVPISMSHLQPGRVSTPSSSPEL